MERAGCEERKKRAPVPASVSADMPLVVDGLADLAVDTESDDGDDIAEDFLRFRQEREAARTLYHEYRADNDTM